MLLEMTILTGIGIFITKKYYEEKYKTNKDFTKFQKKESSIYEKTNYRKDEKTMKENSKTITIKTIGERFHKSSREINKIFEELKWIEKKDRWWVLTPAGETKGGKELYNPKNKTKYTVWNENILHDYELINKINESKETNKNQTNGYNSFYNTTEKKTKMTAKEKKEKGDLYEKYVADFFREQGYYVWEHGKEKGVQDSNIDLFIKKDKYIYFVQCKNWETWKIDHNKIKATRMDVNDYLDNNQMFKEMVNNFNWKILYVTPKKCLTKGAHKYIEENNHLVEYQIIPMN